MRSGTCITAAVLASVIATSAAAQTPAAPPAASQAQAAPKALWAERLDRLLQGVSITAEQRARIDSIYARHVAMVPATPAGAVPDSTARAQLTAHLNAADNEARAALAPELQAVWDRNLAAVRTTRPARP